MEPVLRSGRPGDGARVLALWRGAGAHPSSTDDLETLERLLAEHPGALIVAVDDGVIVGFGDRRLGQAGVGRSTAGSPWLHRIGGTGLPVGSCATRSFDSKSSKRSG